jgi:DsbC/DsbD-like thiol-disulfide interchange protein
VPSFPDMRGILSKVCALIFLVSGAGVVAQEHQGRALVNADLIADTETIVPGRPFTLGLHLRMAEGWHTYWAFPGDSGFPTTLELELPEGFRATEIQWPLPRRLVEPGDIHVYAYKEEVLLMVRVFPPLEIEGNEISIRGRSDWLVCEQICLPGGTDLALTLKVGPQAEPKNQELFQRALGSLPTPLRGRAGEPVQVSWVRDGKSLQLAVEGPNDWRYEFFPLPEETTVLGHPELTAVPRGKAAVVRIPVVEGPETLRQLKGVLVAETADGERRGFIVTGR